MTKLEWKKRKFKTTGENAHRARTDIGEYLILREDVGAFSVWYEDVELGEYRTVPTCKRIAREDYEWRSTPPDTHRTAG